MTLGFRHLLGMEDATREQISTILDLAQTFKTISERPIKKVPTLRGKTVVTFFVEPSTRTRMSFEIAAKRLSADTLNFTASSSSFVKGETLVDTALNLQAMQPDILILRHSQPGSPHLLTRYIDAAVVNAGDGSHEHPTQALLDMFTMRQHKGSLADLEVAIIGDIDHSRVARSNIHGLTKMGANVRVCGPRTMLPAQVEKLGVKVYDHLEAAIEGVDVIMMLRVQKERQEANLFPSDREYHALYGLKRPHLRLAKPDVIVMHPGPMNRCVEIEPEVADGPASVILEQVTNGVAVRMAVLYLLGGGKVGEVSLGGAA
jgi:aspartate carbamoyltransferase catalytic subunit